MKLKSIRALTIAQPWAECILNYGKNVENRQWSTNMRGYFAIHTSMKRDLDRFEDCREAYRLIIDPDDVDFGAVVGFANLVDVIQRRHVSRKTMKWFGGKYGFVVADVIRLKEPVPCKGALMFWHLEGAKLRAGLRQLSQRQLGLVSGSPLSVAR